MLNILIFGVIYYDFEAKPADFCPIKRKTRMIYCHKYEQILKKM